MFLPVIVSALARVTHVAFGLCTRVPVTSLAVC
jgi:hypothetical protein